MPQIFNIPCYKFLNIS